MQWRKLARDGADLPPAQALTVPSRDRLDVGQTRDVELVPAAGTYRLVLGDLKQPLWVRDLVAR